MTPYFSNTGLVPVLFYSRSASGSNCPSTILSLNPSRMASMPSLASAKVRPEGEAMKLESNLDFEIMGFSDSRCKKLTVEIPYRTSTVLKFTTYGTRTPVLSTILNSSEDHARQLHKPKREIPLGPIYSSGLYERVRLRPLRRQGV